MPILIKFTRSLLFMFLLFGGLYFAKDFLVPIIFGGLLAMLLVPVCTWLEQKGMNRALAALLCVLLFVGMAAGMIAILSWQVAGIVGDADQIVAKLNEVPGKLQEYLHRNMGIPIEQQQKIIKEQSTDLNMGGKITLVATSALSMMGTAMLVIIYIFLFIYYRSHLESFVLKMVSVDDKERAKSIMASSGMVAQQYISGLGLMVAALWIMYGIGFSIVGVRHALFFAVLCGLLEIMPYVGNLTGTILTAAMAFTQGGSSMALWILLVYGIIQFTQTYLLEPLVVGARVSINPLCTIVILVIGELVWGIPGMVLAIPLLGIVKIICDSVPKLQPFGYLIGEVKHRQKKVRISAA